MHKSRNSNVANLPFNAIRENKILAKIFEFTVTLRKTCLDDDRLHSSLYRESYMSAYSFIKFIKRVGEKRQNAGFAQHFISFSQRV